VRLTPSTIIDLDAMRDELERIARDRYAVDAEERVPGVACLASVIRDQSGRAIAALSVSGPAMRVTPERMPSLAKDVMAVADQASGIFGGPIPEISGPRRIGVR
jgi:IclR family acetate operon transcriptional repressor